jgi:hypothetical protein
MRRHPDNVVEECRHPGLACDRVCLECRGSFDIVNGERSRATEGEFDEAYGYFDYDEDDMVLIAMLSDPVCASELFWDDPNNHDFSGCYRVRDHQYPMFWGTPDAQQNNEGYACARAVGKTESIKADRGRTRSGAQPRTCSSQRPS